MAPGGPTEDVWYERDIDVDTWGTSQSSEDQDRRLERSLDALESDMKDLMARSPMSEALKISLEITGPALRLLRQNATIPVKRRDRDMDFDPSRSSDSTFFRPDRRGKRASFDGMATLTGEQIALQTLPSDETPEDGPSQDEVPRRPIGEAMGSKFSKGHMRASISGEDRTEFLIDADEMSDNGLEVQSAYSNFSTLRVTKNLANCLSSSADVPDVGGHAALHLSGDAELESRTSMRSVQNTSLGKWVNNDRCYIHPEASFRLAWDMCSICLILILTVVIPYELAFCWDDGDEDILLYIVSIVSDSWFSADIVLNFFTAVHKGQGNRRRLITRPWSIAAHYAKGWLWIDLMATIPFWRIAQEISSGGQGSKSMGVLRALKIAKVTRILKVLRALKLGSLMQVIEETFMLFHSMTVAFQLFKLSFIMLLISHCVACCWFAVGFWGKEFYDNTWLIEEDLLYSPRWQQWAASFYFAITTGTTVGYGDIHATNALERLVGTMLLLSAVAVVAQSIGRLGQVASSLRQAEAEMLRVKRVAMLFCRTRGVSRELCLQVVRYIEHIHATHSVTSLQETGFLEKLSKPLQKKLRLAVIGHFLRKIPLFQDAEDAFVMGICQACTTQRAGIGDTIAQESATNDSLFLVVRGEVKLTRGGQYVGALREEDWFGERSLFQEGLVHKVSMMCESDCEFLVLPRADFIAQVQQHPNVQEEYERLQAGQVTAWARGWRISGAAGENRTSDNGRGSGSEQSDGGYRSGARRSPRTSSRRSSFQGRRTNFASRSSQNPSQREPGSRPKESTHRSSASSAYAEGGRDTHRI